MATTWPRVSGEMAELIRAHAWSATPLGEPDDWPSPLRFGVELMLDSTHPVYIGWGPTLIALYNDAAIPTLGSHHPALGLPWRSVFDEVWDEFEPLIARTLRGEAQCFEDRAVALTGREPPLGYFSFSFTPLRDDAGEVEGVYCPLIETTQRVTAAQATRRAHESRYRALFNSIDEGFCVVEVAFDPDGNPHDFRFLETNPAFEKQSGLTNSVGRWMRELQPQHEQRWFDTLGHVARTGESVRFVENARALGRWFSVYAFRPTHSPANQVAVLFSDITERIESDRALREADRRKDEFLATLAHELRNPLSPMRNGLQLLRHQVPDEPASRETLAMMDRQLTHLVRLVDDLLDVGRISSGKIELQREPLALSRVLMGSMEATRACFEQRHHELTLEGDASHYVVDGDAHRLTQVFTNLLMNACKYTPPGGRVRMTVMRQGGEIVVRVIDNGIGIPTEQASKVFDLFSQVRAHQPLHAGGLGIGLSLVRSLVRLHGGWVEAESEGPGRGSTFTVRLPLLEHALLPEPAAPSHHPSPARPCRVLVADDNDDSAGTLATLLRLQGHEVWTASDGLEAVEQVSERHPDAVLLDIGMPRMDGIEAARRIRQLPGGEQPLLVALTGWGQAGDRERTHAAGFDCHVVKPADPDEIIELITRSRSCEEAHQAS